MNELYNKRQVNYNTLYGANHQQYKERQEYDKTIANHNKKLNDGKQGHVPWGTGYKNQI